MRKPEPDDYADLKDLLNNYPADYWRWFYESLRKPQATVPMRRMFDTAEIEGEQ